jgi:hypothetical protein
MLQQISARSVVYQVLDQVLADQTVAPWSRGAIHSVIDALKGHSAPREDVRRAESISIGLHKLEWALQRNDSAGSEATLAELKSLAADWLDARICN